MIEIISNSALASIQDLGRNGYLRYGVGTSGAMDALALAAGNLLLGNEMGAAAIEVAMFPFQVRFLEDSVFSLTGADACARLGTREISPWWVIKANKGDVLELQSPTRGARCYLALQGGIDVPVVLGSRSTQLRGGFGGLEGRALLKGDILRSANTPARHVDTLDLPAEGFGIIPPEFELLINDDAPSTEGKETAVRVIPAA